MGIHYHSETPDEDIFTITMRPPWTWEEFDHSSKELYGYIRTISHPVATIADVSGVSQLPNGNVLVHLRRLDAIMPENLDISVIVGAPYIITTFMSIMMRLNPRLKNMTMYAKTVEEAIAMIRDRRKQDEVVTE